MNFCEPIPVNETILFGQIQKTNSSRTLNFIDGSLQTHPIFYCGVFAKFVRELSAKHNYGLRRHTVGTPIQALAMSMTTGIVMDIVLVPTTKSNLLISNDLCDSYDIQLSRSLGIITEGHIVSRFRSEEWPKFSYFLSFDGSVYLAMLLSLLTISLYIAGVERNLRSISITFWNYSQVLLSERLPNSAYRRAMNSIGGKIILTVWLLSCTVLLAAFSSVLLYFFSQSLAPDNIDTWEQLYERKEFQILTVETSSMEIFTDLYRDSDRMAADFRQRLHKKYRLSSEPREVSLSERDILSKLVSGEYVFVGNSLYLQTLQDYWDNSVPNGKRLRDRLYVSAEHREITPYFVYYHKSRQELAVEADKLFLQFSESGIYEFWMSKGYYQPKNLSQSDSHERLWTCLANEHMFGVYVMWLFGIIGSILAVIYELINPYIRLI